MERTSTASLTERRSELMGQTEFGQGSGFARQAGACPFARCCWNFARSLDIDPRLWNHHYDKCYCKACVAAWGLGEDGAGAEPEPETAGDEAVAGRHVTAQQRAAQCSGWVYFGLKLDDGRAAARGAWDTWDTAFHGTTSESFKKIVQTGLLLIPGDTTPDGVHLGVRDGHIKGGVLRPGRKDDRVGSIGGGAGLGIGLEVFEPHKMAFVSPSLPYAAHPAYAKPSKFKGVDARAVLKFKVHPDSHPLIPDEDGGTGPSTVHETPADPVIPEDQMEWYTARHSAHLLTGIFIKVDCTKKVLRQTKQAIERELAAPALGPAGARWEWLKNLGDRETGWEPYADDVNARLEQAWENDEDSAEASPGYRVDFDAEVQINTGQPSRRRSVRRVSTVSQARKLRLLSDVKALQGDTPFGESNDPHTNQCAFHQQCWEVLSRIGIRSAHLDHRFDRCFCSSCMTARGDRPAYSGGTHGPGVYVLPKGYARFAMKIDKARADARGFWSEWSVCYHGTRMAALKDIIDAGNLLVPGDKNHNGREVKVVAAVSSRDDNRKPAPAGAQQDPCQIFTSPSIAYVSHPAYAEPVHSRGRSFTFVLQFRIQPGTYEKGPSTLRETPADQHVDESEMEWFTPRCAHADTVMPL